ncbi:Serine/threonine protein kinase [Trema orientale]|uniref:Serine/threonine protein kinase n=1 Tax=Trema orientale TaxID=63057 RepID=A0A2P5FU37_TREOI|nr:Serine/threonine protein kinase [Trema orientale]
MQVTPLVRRLIHQKQAQLVFNESGYMYVLRQNGGTFNLTQGAKVSTRDHYFRATPGFDGVFTQYSHPKSFTGSNRPKCECPKGYSLIDPNDNCGSCKPDFIQGCKEDELSSENDLYDVVDIMNVDWPSSDYTRLPSFTEDMCKEHCLRDCLCAVAIIREGICWKKKLPLSNGRLVLDFSSFTTGSVNGELLEAFVAVRKPNCVVQDVEREFKTEMKAIGQTHHKNLVRLIGYCDYKQHRLPVYGFLCNGTLATFLFGDSKPSWKQRTEIALGVARGLLYLHEECSSQIINCDIKPQNILLDECNNVKISDFDLAKLLAMNQSQTHTAIRGTKGYAAPEWFKNMPITTKVDVYSFGVVLLEVVCRRSSVDMEISGEEKEILTDWAYDCYQDGALDDLVSFEVEALSDRKKLETYVMVAMWCIQENPS